MRGTAYSCFSFSHLMHSPPPPPVSVRWLLRAFVPSPVTVSCICAAASGSIRFWLKRKGQYLESLDAMPYALAAVMLTLATYLGWYCCHCHWPQLRTTIFSGISVKCASIYFSSEICTYTWILSSELKETIILLSWSPVPKDFVCHGKYKPVHPQKPGKLLVEGNLTKLRDLRAWTSHNSTFYKTVTFWRTQKKLVGLIFSPALEWSGLHLLRSDKSIWLQLHTETILVFIHATP